jgi:hypothetical protein
MARVPSPNRLDTEEHIHQRPSSQLRTPRRSLADRETPRTATVDRSLREVARGRDDIRVECAGILAGAWFSSTARRGEDLIAAGLLMLAGPVDLDELDKWMRTGWERRRGADVPYGPAG